MEFKSSPPNNIGREDDAKIVPTITRFDLPSSKAPPFTSLITFLNTNGVEPPNMFLWNDGIRP